jgi:mRNA interferase MazF
MVIRRGDIWWSNLPEPVGSGPGYARPVLVIQSDRFNKSAINTIVVAVISKNTRLAESEGNVLLTKAQSDLPHDSVVNVSQLFTIDEITLRDRVTTVSEKKMTQVDDGLKKVLGL